MLNFAVFGPELRPRPLFNVWHNVSTEEVCFRPCTQNMPDDWILITNPLPRLDARMFIDDMKDRIQRQNAETFNAR
jgi:hypothetical protein